MCMRIEDLKGEFVHGRIQKTAEVFNAEMLVGSMTKNMRDFLLHKMMQTGSRAPKSSEVYSSLDALYPDPGEP